MGYACISVDKDGWPDKDGSAQLVFEKTNPYVIAWRWEKFIGVGSK